MSFIKLDHEETDLINFAETSDITGMFAKALVAYKVAHLNDVLDLTTAKRGYWARKTNANLGAYCCIGFYKGVSISECLNTIKTLINIIQAEKLRLVFKADNGATFNIEGRTNRIDVEVLDAKGFDICQSKFIGKQGLLNRIEFVLRQFSSIDTLALSEEEPQPQVQVEHKAAS